MRSYPSVPLLLRPLCPCALGKRRSLRDANRTVSSEAEDSPDSTPRARALRSMHTGQNSIAPESSLPQLGQVRCGSVFMDLTALQPQSEPKATPRSTEWCEIGQHGPWQSVVPLHKQLGVHL